MNSDVVSVLLTISLMGISISVFTFVLMIIFIVGEMNDRK